MALNQDFGAPQNDVPGAGQNPQATPDDSFSGAPGGSGDQNGDVFNFLNRTSGLSLSPQHKKYVEEISDEAKRFLPSLEVVGLHSPAGSHAFITKGREGVSYAYLLVFTATISPNPDLLPDSDRIKDAMESLNRRKDLGQIHIIDSQLVSDRDLHRSTQMTKAIVGALLIASDPQLRNTNAAKFSPQHEWVVNPDVNAAIDFYNRNSPVEVVQPIDFGFTMGLRQRRNQYGSSFDPNGQVETILACGGYTDIIGPFPDPQTRIMKWLPVVHMLPTVSPMPVLAAELLALPQFTQMAIINQGWKLPFMKFRPKTPNLGNLRANPSKPNELWFASNADEMEQFIRDQFFPPIVVMDIPEGGQRIPARFLFAGRHPDHLDHILTETANFFKVAKPTFSSPIANVFATEYVGTYGDGVPTDSRNLTYLKKVTEGALDAETFTTLTNYQQDPSRRARCIANMSHNFHSLYRNRLSLISSSFLVWLSSAVEASGLRIFDPTTQTGVVPMAGFVQQASDFTGFRSFAYQRQGGVNDGFGLYTL